MDKEFHVGDLVQFKQRAKYPLFHKLWQDKIGVVSAIRNGSKIAYIKWSDTDANDVWIAYEDLVLLNRE